MYVISNGHAHRAMLAAGNTEEAMLAAMQMYFCNVIVEAQTLEDLLLACLAA